MNPIIDHGDPRPEIWLWPQFRKEIIDSVKESKPGVCEFGKLPERLVIAGPLLERAREIGKETASTGREIGFSIFHTPKKGGGLMLERKRDSSSPDGIKTQVVFNRDYRIPIDINELTSEEKEIYRRITNLLDKGDNIDSILNSNDPDMIDFFRRNYFERVGYVHSHPINLSFSLTDLYTSLSSAQPHRLALVTEPDDSLDLLVTCRDTDFIPKEYEDKNGKQILSEWLRKYNNDFNVMQEFAGKELYDGLRCIGKILRQDSFTNALIRERLIKSIAKQRKFGYYKGDGSGIMWREA